MIVSATLFNCSSDSDKGADGGGLTDADGIASILVIPNATVVNSPNLPASSSAAVAPMVSQIDTNVSYTAGSQMYLPSTVVSQTGSNIAGVYVQVQGASTYFDVAINSISSDAMVSLPIDLAGVLGNGTFTLLLKFYDEEGNISLEVVVKVTITSPDNCNTTKVSGGAGLTSNIFTLPNEAGDVRIAYDTYTVPDKIDIYQNGIWRAGTGFMTSRNALRRALNCNVATEAAGYVGEEGELVFSYNPALGQEIEVVVSGCEDGGTLWEYTFSCPEEPSVGESNFTIDNTPYTSNVNTNCAIITSNNEFFSSASSGTSGNANYVNVVLMFKTKPTTSGTYAVGHEWDVAPEPGEVIIHSYKGGKDYGSRNEGTVQVTVVNGKVKATFTNITLKSDNNVPMVVSASIGCP